MRDEQGTAATAGAELPMPPCLDCHGDRQKVQLFIGEKQAGAAGWDGWTWTLPAIGCLEPSTLPGWQHHPHIRQGKAVVLPRLSCAGAEAPCRLAAVSLCCAILEHPGPPRSQPELLAVPRWERDRRDRQCVRAVLGSKP